MIVASPAQAQDGAAARGEKVFQYCYACHSVQPGEANLQGPNLRGIIGGRIAAQESFAYSPAMRRFAQQEERWSEALLDRYIAVPHEVIPNTSMEFRGVEDAAERADLITYLRSLGKGV